MIFFDLVALKLNTFGVNNGLSNDFPPVDVPNKIFCGLSKKILFLMFKHFAKRLYNEKWLLWDLNPRPFGIAP